MNKKHVVSDAMKSGKNPATAMLEGVRYYSDLISSNIYPIDGMDIIAALVALETTANIIRSDSKEVEAMADITKMLIRYDYKSISRTLLFPLHMIQSTGYQSHTSTPSRRGRKSQSVF